MTISKSMANKIQRALRETVEPTLKLDGILGSNSLKALQKLSKELGMGEVNDFSGPVFDLLVQFIDKRYISDDGFAKVAAELGVEEASVRAIAEVESRGDGFAKDGSLVILFERHWFRTNLIKALKNKAVREHVVQVIGVDGVDTDADSSVAVILELVTQKYPNICNAVRGGYLGGAQEWTRIEQAITIHPDSAYMSASYGSFQIMGFNHAACGYNTAAQMLLDFAESEDNQFLGVGRFIKADKTLHDALKIRDWAKFAYGYNGSSYAEHKYDVRLGDAYAKWVKLLKAK